jgi:hypothetical protein
MSEAKLQELLTAVTDALLSEERDAESVIAHYEVSRAEVDPLLALIRRLRTLFVRVQPSRRYINRLRADLRGTPQPDVITRIRFLPARVHIAAGVALVAGFALLLGRRAAWLARQQSSSEVAEASAT